MGKRALDEGWEFRQKGVGDWLPAQTPGHVHLDLLRCGVIPDPYDRMHEMGVQWVDEADWEYRLRFHGSEGSILLFEGLDTVCTIFLNDEQVAEGNNMFVPVEVDVAGRLKEENELRIEFAAPRRIARERRAQYFAEQGLAEDTVSFYDWCFLRKAPYMFGWDWGPRLASCGIWKPVCLLDASPRLKHIWPRQTHQAGGVELSIEVERIGAGEIRHRLIAPDGAETQFDGQAVIDDPWLWWPNGEGGQPLYTLVTQLVAGGEVVDERSQLLGLRTVELIQQPDQHGVSFEFAVNGRRIWSRGANWIPDDSFPSRLSKRRIEAQIERAAQMNCNMLRVWGGGLYESDYFYNACLQQGILVWQDFAFACSYAPDSPAWVEQYRVEAEHVVRALRGHSALALWCGNNECQTMWEGRWGGADKSPDRCHGQAVWERELREVVERLDPDRGYISTSPMGLEGDCNGGGTGDQHYWDVWHGRGDWIHYAESTARFSSEFGFASSPSLAVWQRHLKDEDLDPYSPQVKWHDKTLKGYDTYLGYTALHYAPILTMEDLVYYTQLNQRDAMRFALEHYRCSDFCRGALIWQLNDCWPVQSWALIDSEKRLKFAGHEMRRCFAPKMLAVREKGEQVEVWAVNDSPDALTAELTVRVISLRDGAVLDGAGAPVRSEPGSRSMILSIDRQPGTLLVAECGPLRVSRLIGEPKDSVFGDPQIEAGLESNAVILKAMAVPAVDVWLRAPGDAAEFADNGFTLLPGEAKRVEFTGTVSDLHVRCLGFESVRLG